MRSLQIVRDPEKIEPPDGVNHEFPGGKRPHLPVRQKLAPFDLSRLCNRVAFNVVSFAAGAVGMLFGISIEP